MTAFPRVQEVRRLSKLLFGNSLRLEVGAAIAEADSDVYARLLANRLGVRDNQVAAELKNLEEAGLIERAPPGSALPGGGRPPVLYRRRPSAFWHLVSAYAREAMLERQVQHRDASLSDRQVPRDGGELDWKALSEQAEVAALRLTRDRAIAEEVAQEALITIWNAKDRLADAAHAERWVRHVAERAAIRLLARDRTVRRASPSHVSFSSLDEQSERRADSIEGGAFPDTPVEDVPSPRLMIKDLLGHLSETDQRILMLRYAAELSPTEIARVLNIPAGAVRSRHHRAIQRMRRLIDAGAPSEVGGG